jgi:hypothetical protein
MLSLKNTPEKYSMMELTALRKNKIHLSDYNYAKDIENRLLMANFSTFDVEVLEEILFSPLKIPLTKLARSLEAPIEQLQPVLDKLEKAGLFSMQEDVIVVDKEMRKYFEAHIQKFDEDFAPDMEFLQSLLKKIPIHVLPVWYSIPRTSNNIFESIVEKYLLTPSIYQRFLSEVGTDDLVFVGIIQDLFSAPGYKLFTDEVERKYQLTRYEVEEYILHLEYNFVGCLSYAKVDDTWKEVITPFREWKDYLDFLENAKPSPITPALKSKEKPFSFVEDLSSLLKNKLKDKDPEYVKFLEEKLCKVKLAQKVKGIAQPTEHAQEWLNMDIENRALYLYRHPLNTLSSVGFPAELASEKNLREVEKGLKDVSGIGWLFIDDFIKGALIPLNEGAKISLRKVGKNWKYALPQYGDEEKAFIKAVITEALREAGITETSEKDGKTCFCITSFGQMLLGS